MERKGGLWMKAEISRCQEKQKIEEKLRKSKFAKEYREIIYLAQWKLRNT